MKNFLKQNWQLIVIALMFIGILGVVYIHNKPKDITILTAYEYSLAKLETCNEQVEELKYDIPKHYIPKGRINEIKDLLEVIGKIYTNVERLERKYMNEESYLIKDHSIQTEEDIDFDPLNELL